MAYFFSRLLVHARSVWNHRWSALAAAWCTGALSFLFIHALPDEYQSAARVYVDTQSILKPLLANMTSVPNVQQQVSIMSRTLLSRPNLEQVLRMTDQDILATSAVQRDAQIARLQGRIKIGGTSAEDIYTISYRDHDRTRARAVVQSLLTLFLEGSFQGKRGDSDQAIRFLDQQIALVETRLQAAENSLKEFKVRNAGLLPRMGADHSAQLAAASDALGAAELELAEARQTHQAILHQINGGAPRAGSPRLVNVELDARLAEASRQLDLLRTQYTERHPDVLSARRLLAQLEERRRQDRRRPARDTDPGRAFSPMLQQLNVALTEADARIAATRVRVFEYSARVARLRKQSEHAPAVEAQLAQLNRDYAVNREQYDKLIGRREAARLSGELSASTDMMTFRIIDPPSQPLVPIGPERRILYTLALLGALGTGIALALIVAHVRPTFGSGNELREETGFTVLGSVALHQCLPLQQARRRDAWRAAMATAALPLLYAAMLVID